MATMRSDSMLVRRIFLGASKRLFILNGIIVGYAKVHLFLVNLAVGAFECLTFKKSCGESVAILAFKLSYFSFAR